MEFNGNFPAPNAFGGGRCRTQFTLLLAHGVGHSQGRIPQVGRTRRSFTVASAVVAASGLFGLVSTSLAFKRRSLADARRALRSLKGALQFQLPRELNAFAKSRPEIRIVETCAACLVRRTWTRRPSSESTWSVACPKLSHLLPTCKTSPHAHQFHSMSLFSQHGGWRLHRTAQTPLVSLCPRAFMSEAMVTWFARCRWRRSNGRSCWTR